METLTQQPDTHYLLAASFATARLSPRSPRPLAFLPPNSPGCLHAFTAKLVK